ncbi:MAG: PQQ-binding-like beta-propeller repeat protein [Vicinamibacterales bacterium]|nr:PQQ-binding-like beta-propeller repeat protein [Vicinamibacterales bacterium]
MPRLMRCGLVAVCLLAVATEGLAQQGVSDGEWRHSNGDAGATRYAALDQITAENVGSLRVAWEWAGANFGPTPEFKSETTPLMVDGVLYFTAGLRRDVIAIDAGTGETLWIHRFDEGARGLAAPRRNSGRGVSYWTDGVGDERIFVITPGFHLIALDAATGWPMPNFGNDGIVDMKRGFDQSVALDEQNLGSSSPGMVFEDLIIVGPAMAGSGRPASQVGVPSHITAWDTRTGDRRWIFHTVPKPGEFGYDTWEDDSARIGGNAGAWAPLALDPELGYVYLPLEVATSDYYGGHRLGDNLFSSSLVCLDARTGERVWHFQTVHHDVYEYDNPSAPILMDVTVNGREVPAVVQLTKQALVFAFDRVTGEPLWPIEERPVPQSDVPGERTSPTQPFPTKPAPMDQQGATEDDLIDLTPRLREEALAIARRFRLGPLYAPPSLAEADDGTIGTFQVPGTAGGALWEGGAVDVETGVLYVGTTTGLTVLSLTHDPDASDVEYISAGVRVAGPQGLPLFKPPFGRITAIDMNTGEHLWMKPNGGTPAAIRNHPALAGVDFPPTGSRTRALLLATPTLLFAGEGWGGEPYFRAYDKRSGEIVAEIELPAPMSSLPMTYMHDGTQFIVFAAGDRRTGQPGKLIALTLPDDGE